MLQDFSTTLLYNLQVYCFYRSSLYVSNLLSCRNKHFTSLKKRGTEHMAALEWRDYKQVWRDSEAVYRCGYVVPVTFPRSKSVLTIRLLSQQTREYADWSRLQTLPPATDLHLESSISLLSEMVPRHFDGISLCVLSTILSFRRSCPATQ